MEVRAQARKEGSDARHHDSPIRPWLLAVALIVSAAATLQLGTMRVAVAFLSLMAPSGPQRRENCHTTFRMGNITNSSMPSGTTMPKSTDRCSPNHRAPAVAMPPPLKI